jgi:hypothetical protein
MTRYHHEPPTQGWCPRCGAEVLLEWDSDGHATWLHEVWRTCPCPMPLDWTLYLPEPDPYT